ncbi:unnamed protein product, partial [Mesorhabditis spiculigera]
MSPSRSLRNASSVAAATNQFEADGAPPPKPVEKPRPINMSNAFRDALSAPKMEQVKKRPKRIVKPTESTGSQRRSSAARKANKPIKVGD